MRVNNELRQNLKNIRSNQQLYYDDMYHHPSTHDTTISEFLRTQQSPYTTTEANADIQRLEDMVLEALAKLHKNEKEKEQ